MGFNYWLQPFLDLLFPVACASCRRISSGSLSLCDSCMDEVRYLRSPLCVRCGTLFGDGNGGDHICGDCLRRPPPFILARAVTHYAPPVSTLLHLLKYRTDRTVLSTLSHIAVPFDFAPFASCDLIVPVPLHLRRLRERGLNQSLLLAHIFFSRQAEAIHPEILVRTRDTVPQTGLGGKERRKNLRAAFAVIQDADINGKGVCLVDDVLTTGATVIECASALMRAGAKEVKVLTMARAVERLIVGPDVRDSSEVDQG
jgi:ComF family protein